VHHIECSLEPGEFRALVETIRSGRPLRDLYAELPPAAFDSHLGMTAIEREFLVRQTYGRAFVGRESHFHAGAPETAAAGMGRPGRERAA
jgi:hypothetical protein